MTSPEQVTRGRGERPLYVQLAEEIADRIRRGALRPGDRVASEPELVRRHGVSRSTAVRALERLEQAGLVRREQGRGTFVEEPRLVQRQPLLGSFSEQVRRHGNVPTQRLLELAEVTGVQAGATARWFTDDEALVRLVRLRLVDGEPVGIHTTHLPRAVAEQAGIDQRSLSAPDASLYERLDAAGIRVVEADEHLQAISASRTEAKLLGVRAGSALMRVLRVSFGARGAPIEVADARYVGDRFDYSVTLVRARPGAEAEPMMRGGNDASLDARGAGALGGRRGDGGRVRQVGRRGV